jgi:hypothetical protein
MKRSETLVALVACGLMAVLGCGSEYDQPIRDQSSPPAAKPAESKPAKPAQAEESANKAPAPPAEEKPRQSPPARPSQQAQRPPAGPAIQLSAGVALPQSLPTGTAMGFSVDYQFSSGQPDPSADYFWVIQPSKGQAARQPVRLKPQGTLEMFVLEFRPENGPFQTCIEDKSGTRLSKTVPLR